jgi:H+/Cl- antiporter ClcA
LPFYGKDMRVLVGRARTIPQHDQEKENKGMSLGSTLREKFLRCAEFLMQQKIERLGDFTTTLHLVPIALLALAIGMASAYLALFLLKLIAFFTNLFFFQRLGSYPISPANHNLGVFAVFVPVAGALIVGLMARFGSERIRGHGIPEAIEAILMNGSRVEPRLALLKPLSAAISIGSGGPFGAEGPIIMTGGAFGSMVAQFFHLTSAERKTLLVAGAAGGMSATFATPVAAAMLAVELLLFEWKPRSFIPVALASASAAATRRYLLGLGPLFATPPHPLFIGIEGLAGCAAAGLLAGLAAAILTAAVYAAEDAFSKIPIHWMWWPSIGGLVIGIGGWIFPQALGVGYDTIAALLTADVPNRMILGILIVKSTIWSISLGSGTSGGVLAPLLLIGGALGGFEARFFPNEGLAFWPLVSMGAVLGGMMRSPLTAVIFSFELTHDVNVLLPLLVASAFAHGISVLTMRRSILTEKVARRGYHLSREYAVDPLEILFVGEVMRTKLVVLPARLTLAELSRIDRGHPHGRRQRLYPLVDARNQLWGVATDRDLENLKQQLLHGDGHSVHEYAQSNPVVAYMDEPLRVVAYRMAETGKTRLPVLKDRTDRNLVGMILLRDLLQARSRHLEEERLREQILRVRFAWFGERRNARELPVQPPPTGKNGGMNSNLSQ